jgi:hypothetical protein
MERLLEKFRLILFVEADLKPDAASVARNGFERGWPDFPVIQPRADSVHSFAERTFRFLFDTHDEGGTERHDAPFLCL